MPAWDIAPVTVARLNTLASVITQILHCFAHAQRANTQSLAGVNQIINMQFAAAFAVCLVFDKSKCCLPRLPSRHLKYACLLLGLPQAFAACHW